MHRRFLAFAAAVRPNVTSAPLRRYKSSHVAQQTAFGKSDDLMPDLSHPKWKRRDKLHAINFANKGKSGFRQGSKGTGDGLPTPSRREQELARLRRPKEHLPRVKTSTEPSTRLEDPEYELAYTALKDAAISPHSRRLPDSINLDRLIHSNVPLLPLSRLEELQMSEINRVNDRIRQTELSANLPLLPGAFDKSSANGLQNVDIVSANNGLVPAIVLDDSSPIDSDSSHLNDQEFLKDILSVDAKSSLSPLNESLLTEFRQQLDTKTVTRTDFRDVVILNSKLGRSEECEKTIVLMEEYGIKPQLLEYNQLMNSYARQKDLPNTLKTFCRIKERGLEPDVSSFGVVIKCLASMSKIQDAFRLYDQMKLLNIQPSQPIITTLIQGCINVKDYNRAWKLFDHLRMSIERPDEIAYTLMIHACAKSNQPEKALSLFNEMSRTVGPNGDRLYPIEATYSAVIHACAKRPEYYRHIFNIVSQLEESGYKCDRVTYNYLFLACKTQGDLPRAKALWKDMLAQAALSDMDKKMAPDVNSYMLLMGTFSKAAYLICDIWRKTLWREMMQKFERKVLEAKLGMENENRLRKGQTPIDINYWIADEDFNPDRPAEIVGGEDEHLKSMRDYMSEGYPETERLQLLAKEATEFINMVDHRFQSDKNLKFNTNLLNSQIELLGTYGKKRSAVDVFEKSFDKFAVEKNASSYLRILKALLDPRSSFQEIKTSLERAVGASDPIESHWSEEQVDPMYSLVKALDFHKEYESFRKKHGFPEKWDELESKDKRIHYQEMGIGHFQRKTEYVIYRTVILGLAMHNNISGAVELLQRLLDRRHARVSGILQTHLDTYLPSTSQLTGSDSIVSSTLALNAAQKQAVALTTEAKENHDPDQRSLDLFVKLHQRAPSESSEDGQPIIISQISSFDPKDFQPLLQRARDSGSIEMVAKIESFLKQAYMGLEKDRIEKLERLTRSRKRLQTRMKGIKFDAKFNRI